jgi:hypothetical protein
MSPQINTSYVFQTASAYYLHFAGKRVKRCFLVTDVSMGKITLSCRQHVACLLGVEWDHPTATIIA